MSRSTAAVDPLEPEIRALRVRQRALEAAVGTGESGKAWRDAQAAFDRLEANLNVNPVTTTSLRAINDSKATLRAILREGVAGTAIWEEIKRNAETIRKLIDSTRRRPSAQDRHADRLADREARLEEALADTGIGRHPPPPPARRQAGRRRRTP